VKCVLVLPLVLAACSFSTAPLGAGYDRAGASAELAGRDAVYVLGTAGAGSLREAAAEPTDAVRRPAEAGPPQHPDAGQSEVTDAGGPAVRPGTDAGADSGEPSVADAGDAAPVLGAWLCGRCTQDADCAVGAVCSGGYCAPVLAPSQTCEDLCPGGARLPHPIEPTERVSPATRICRIPFGSEAYDCARFTGC